MKHIFLLEDDETLGRGIVMALTGPEASVMCRSTLAQAWEALAEERFDLLILDINLPDGSGLDLLRQVRTNGDATPVILLTANDLELDEVTGLEAGADDYITKPFGWRELFARIEVALRRSQPSAPQSQEDNALRVKDLAIYPDKYVVEQDGRRVDLTPTEFGILRVLAEHRGNIVTRNELNEALGITNNGGEIRSLDVHMRNLRKKLGDDIQECRYIETIRRIGFRINE